MGGDSLRGSLRRKFDVGRHRNFFRLRASDRSRIPPSLAPGPMGAVEELPGGENMKRLAKLRIFAWVLVFAGFGLAIAFAQSADPKEAAAKLEPGAYYWAGTAWQPLEPLTWSANGVKKDGKSYVWSYRHPQARVQLTGRSPLFCFKSIAAPGDPNAPSSPNIVIARLEQKKDYRQLQSPSADGAFKFNAGLSKERTPEVTVTDVAPGVVLISPKEPLSPGEYILGGSSLTIAGFDFGIHSAK